MLDYVLSKVANGHSSKPNERSSKRSSRLFAVSGQTTALSGAKPEPDNIDQLTSLISSSAAEIKSRYRSAGLPPPSLDDTAAIGLEAMDESSKQAIARATRIIEAACAQLRATISRPEHVLLDVRSFL